MAITVREYLSQHAAPGTATPDIVANAETLLERVNRLLANSPLPDAELRSGWRPPAFNATVPNAAPNSKHMTGQAVDVADNDEVLDGWLTDEILEKYELWREAPSSSPSWCHLQSVPPRSGKRTFTP